jgi:hypothetical protein
MIRAELADGTVLEFPDGTDPMVIQQTVKKMLAQNPEMGVGQKALRAGEFASRGFMESAAETLGALPELAASGLRAVGMPAPEAGYYPEAIKSGARQFGQAIYAPINDAVDFGPSEPQSTLERGAYGAGRGVANAASFMLPGAAVSKFAQAGTLPSRVGGVMASQPVAQAVAGGVAGGVGEATGSDMAGLAAGLALPSVTGLARGLGRKAVTPFPSQLSQNEQRLAAEAQSMGMDLTPGQLTGSPGLRTMESMFAQLPFTAKSQGAKYAGQRTSFNRAVLEKAGISADDASPEVMDKAFRSIGKEFDDLAARTTVNVDQQLFDDVAGISQDYGRRLPTDVAPVFKSYVDDLAVMHRELGNAPQVAGSEYQKISSEIKRKARQSASRPELQDALNRLAGTLDSALERSSGSEMRRAWADVRNRYRNMLTIDEAMGAGTSGSRSAGDIPFTGLRTSVKGMDKRGYARGRGDLNKLSRVGDFLGSAIPPDSGTPRRQMMQNLLTFGAGGGGAGFLAAGGDPVIAAIVAGAAAGGPKAAQLAYNTPALQAYLKNQMIKSPKGARSLQALLGKIATAQLAGQAIE